MWSIIASILGWVLAKLFGKVKESRLEEKYTRARKENLELRAENAGLRVVKEIADSELKVKEDWDNADEKEKYKILRRDFDADD